MSMSRGGWDWTYIAYDGLVAVGACFVSLLVWAQQPRGVVGPLLYLYTLAFIELALRGEPSPLLIIGNWLVVALTAPVFAHIVLAFLPAGSTRPERGPSWRPRTSTP